MLVRRRQKTLQRIDQITIGLELGFELGFELGLELGRSRRSQSRKVITHLKQLKRMDGAHEADQLTSSALFLHMAGLRVHSPPFPCPLPIGAVGSEKLISSGTSPFV
jgi:hypothetical protein